MKIGIITIHNSPNYGACLQSFALYKYLEWQGWNVEIIDLHRPCNQDYVPSKKYLPYCHNPKSKRQQVKDLIRHLLNLRKDVGQKTDVISNILVRKSNENSQKAFEKFNKRIRLSRIYRGIDELYESPPQYDIYITGSDQVWNPTQPFCIEPYFLTFVKKGKKVSYGASIGINELTKKEKKDFQRWLNQYDALSVRELKAQKLLSSFVKRPISVVSDPTFLLSVDYWMSIAKMPSISNYILIFTLDVEPEIINYGEKLAKESNKHLVVLHQELQTNSKNYLAVTDAGPTEFIGYIANADMLITDSFHATVFSILMGTKNFYTYISPWNARGSRITDLLYTFNLNNHLLGVDLSLSYNELEVNKINRNAVLEVLKREQTHSREFLIQNLK